jgi:hypothetical protein
VEISKSGYPSDRYLRNGKKFFKNSLKLSMVEHSGNPRTEEAEAGGSQETAFFKNLHYLGQKKAQSSRALAAWERFHIGVIPLALKRTHCHLCQDALGCIWEHCVSSRADFHLHWLNFRSHRITDDLMALQILSSKCFSQNFPFIFHLVFVLIC